MDLSEFTADLLQPHVGTTFRLAAPDGTQHDLKLTKVTKVVDQHVDPRFHRDSFTLLFSGPAQPYLPQATYPLTHDSLGGPYEIFIVPTGQDATGFHYQAVFT
jgi:hypothetical protein